MDGIICLFYHICFSKMINSVKKLIVSNRRYSEIQVHTSLTKHGFSYDGGHEAILNNEQNTKESRQTMTIMINYNTRTALKISVINFCGKGGGKAGLYPVFMRT